MTKVSMTKEEKDQKVWEIIDKYEGDEQYGFSFAIDDFAALDNYDVDEVIADLEYMVGGVLTDESRDLVAARVEELAKNSKK